MGKRIRKDTAPLTTNDTLNRWCLINSYLTTTRNHGLTVLDAITRALTGQPWLPAPATAA